MYKFEANKGKVWKGIALSLSILSLGAFLMIVATEYLFGGMALIFGLFAIVFTIMSASKSLTLEISEDGILYPSLCDQPFKWEDIYDLEIIDILNTKAIDFRLNDIDCYEIKNDFNKKSRRLYNIKDITIFLSNYPNSLDRITEGLSKYYMNERITIEVYSGQ